MLLRLGPDRGNCEEVEDGDAVRCRFNDFMASLDGAAVFRRRCSRWTYYPLGVEGLTTTSVEGELIGSRAYIKGGRGSGPVMLMVCSGKTFYPVGSIINLGLTPRSICFKENKEP